MSTNGSPCATVQAQPQDATGELDRIIARAAVQVGVALAHDQRAELNRAVQWGILRALLTAQADRDERRIASTAGLRESLAAHERSETARRWWSPQARAARQEELRARLPELRARDRNAPTFS